MKNFLRKYKICCFLAALLMMLMACTSSEDRELFEITDHFVENLQTTYQSYGLSTKFEETTKSGTYQVIPIGRMINVKIMHYASSSDYEDLCNTLKKHYKGDSRVNNVYVCQAGTVMVDCRN